MKFGPSNLKVLLGALRSGGWDTLENRKMDLKEDAACQST